jgi:hypothetical protein
MNPGRSGLTLIEMVAVLAFVLPTAGLALSLAATLASSRAPTAGTALDLVCEHLRRDAAAGARISGTSLQAGTHQWSQQGDWLCRDGVQRVRLLATWTQVDAAVVVAFHPEHLPARKLRLEAQPEGSKP